jgi:hypothetical protein
MEFRIDIVTVATFSEAPYEYLWDISAVSQGAHSIQVRAYEVGGQQDIKTITVFVGQAVTLPAVTFVNPTQSSEVRGAVQIQINVASDANYQVSRVTVEIVKGATTVKTFPAVTSDFDSIELSWDTSNSTLTPDGEYTLSVTVEYVGGSMREVSISFKVANETPWAPSPGFELLSLLLASACAATAISLVKHRHRGR